ncbi:MAG: hypothetical protein N3I35_05320 [Clostridia bacterium]|nr:hypothetical protein [Clostridia bacterium]
MTDETLFELQRKVGRAETIKRQINDLKMILERGDQVKIWGLCLYYDEECNDSQYMDLPNEGIKEFVDKFVKKQIAILEKEFKTL